MVFPENIQKIPTKDLGEALWDARLDEKRFLEIARELERRAEESLSKIKERTMDGQ
jgi:hypothetical protein